MWGFELWGTGGLPSLILISLPRNEGFVAKGWLELVGVVQHLRWDLRIVFSAIGVLETSCSLTILVQNLSKMKRSELCSE